MKQIVEKNNKGEIWFFENINKIEKPLARMFKGGGGEKHANMVWGKLLHLVCPGMHPSAPAIGTWIRQQH